MGKSEYLQIENLMKARQYLVAKVGLRRCISRPYLKNRITQKDIANGKDGHSHEEYTQSKMEKRLYTKKVLM
jgi:hypothetical protein